MATNTLHSLQHHSTTRQRVGSCASPTTFPATLFLQTNNPTISISSNSISITPFSSSAATSFSETTTTSSTFETLETHLINQDFRQADEETRRLIIQLSGEAAIKRGYVFFSEVQFIPEHDLKLIDTLWKQHSNNKFGYSVQKKIWRKCGKDFTNLFIKIGWMKLLDTEVVQYNYKAFPNEFDWEISDDSTSPPQGHLPLTNALRGTQLLNCILNHPAFESGDEESDDEFGGSGGAVFTKPLSNNTTGFNTDYSF